MKKLIASASAFILLFSSGFANDIADIDKNFREEKLVNGQKIAFYSVYEAPFEITGFPWRKPGSTILRRIPPTMTAKDVNRGVISLGKCTTGGAIRFATDSPVVVIRGMVETGRDMCHMTRIGSAGFDLVQDCGTPHEELSKPGFPRRPAVDGKTPTTMVAKFKNTGEMREFTIFLPLYSGMNDLVVGIVPGKKIAAPKPQKIKDPVCFYGSSVTQGGCASRPANNYTTMLCRAIDAPQVNLGFSGSAKGEPAMARAIASLKLSAFVMDYDYNAPTAAHLKKTHEKFFKIIRAAQPDLPIIIVSGPRVKTRPDSIKRRDIVKATYDNAIAAGDKNVYFFDGLEFFTEVPRRFVTVDGSHPTDLGFYVMYQKLLPILKDALKIK